MSELMSDDDNETIILASSTMIYGMQLCVITKVLKENGVILCGFDRGYSYDWLVQSTALSTA